MFTPQGEVTLKPSRTQDTKNQPKAQAFMSHRLCLLTLLSFCFVFSCSSTLFAANPDQPASKKAQAKPAKPAASKKVNPDKRSAPSKKAKAKSDEGKFDPEIKFPDKPFGSIQDKKPAKRKPPSKLQTLQVKGYRFFGRDLDRHSLADLIKGLSRRDWAEQRLLLKKIARFGTQAIPTLRKATKSSSIRTRLLAAIALSRLHDRSSIPMLIQLAKQFHDQPTPLLHGAFREYGAQVTKAIIQALKAKKSPKILLEAIGYLRIREGLPLLRDYLVHSKKTMRGIAREALMRFAPEFIVHNIKETLKKKPSATVRAELFRAMAFIPSGLMFPTLVKHVEDKDPSIRFLLRLTLKDKINELKTAGMVTLQGPPLKNKKADWAFWWKNNYQRVMVHYVKKKNNRLKALPGQKDRRHMTILYRTIHPVFGYGRMPLLVHDSRNKKPISPVAGKVWKLALAPKAFNTLLERIQKSGFFKWTPNSGSVRDLTLSLGSSQHRFSLNTTRHFAFERLETELLKLAKKAKLGLKFEDFYNRKDEEDLGEEGKIGQWAYRSHDALPLVKWSASKGWKSEADIESTLAAIRELIRYTPSRSRLISFDQRIRKIRLSFLLFGSRSLARLTLSKLQFARRLLKVDYKGVNVTYLHRDKVERLFLDMGRLRIPQNSHTEKNRKSIPILDCLRNALPSKNFKVEELTVKKGKPYRLFVRFKAKNTFQVIHFLTTLAMHSQGDKVLALRINQSGEADRSKYGLIVQMQWEMLPPLRAPKKRPYFLKIPKKPLHEIFAPVYR